MWKSLIGTAVLLGLFVGNASATPIIFNEAVDGDLAQSPRRTFALGFGVNTFVGIAGDADGGDPSDIKADFDVFNAVLPEGAVLDFITFSMTPLEPDTRYSASLGPIVLDGADTLLGTAADLVHMRFTLLSGTPILFSDGPENGITATVYFIQNDCSVS